MTPVQGPDREEQLNQMVLMYEKDLLRVCVVYLRDVDLARDAVQETFLKAYRRMDRFKGNSSEKTWLMRIAINTCQDMLRGSWSGMWIIPPCWMTCLCPYPRPAWSISR